MDESPPDKWADWVLERGHGELPEDERVDLSYLQPIRDRVLADASISSGDTLLDVGAGQGLIGFAALAHVGVGGRVIFSDISQPLLDHCRERAQVLGVLDRTTFVRAAAEDLVPIHDESIDVVTARSVLIYVTGKGRAFAEFHRVLRPGGRVSIFEPINRYFEMRDEDFWGFNASPVHDLVAKMNAWEGWDQLPEDDPMMNFGEHDLYDQALAAGFEEVRVTLVVERKNGRWVKDWKSLLKTAPNPNAHTVEEIIEGALSSDEADRFETYMKPVVDRGHSVIESAFAYLSATKA